MEKKDLTLGDLLSVAYKWLWLLVVGMVIASFLAFYYAEFCMTPMYESTSKCYVQASEDAIKTSSADALIGEQRGIALAQMVVVNYMEILDTNYFAGEIQSYLSGNVKPSDSPEKQAAVKALGKTSKEYTAEDIKKMIKYTTLEETSVFNIAVKGDNYKDVGKIAKCIEIVMMDYIESKAPGSGVITVIDGAYDNEKPVNNYTVLFSLAGLIIGFIVAFIVAFSLDSNDTRIKDDNTLTELFGLPVIGAIPDVSTLDQNEVPYAVKRK